jgi:hypothetical protein
MNAMTWDNHEATASTTRHGGAAIGSRRQSSPAAESLPDLLLLLERRRQSQTTSSKRSMTLHHPTSNSTIPSSEKTSSVAAGRFMEILNGPISPSSSSSPKRTKKSLTQRRSHHHHHDHDVPSAVEIETSLSDMKINRKKRSSEELYNGDESSDMPAAIQLAAAETRRRSLEAQSLKYNHKLGTKSLTIANCLGLQIRKTNSLVGSRLSIANQRSAHNEYHRSKANAEWKF